MKPRKFPLQLNEVKLFSQKKKKKKRIQWNTLYIPSLHIHIYNLNIANKRRNQIKFTPTSWLTTHPISIYNLKIILNLQSNFTTLKYSHSHFFCFLVKKEKILTFNINSKCIIKNHHKFHNIEILRNVFTKESKNGHEKQKQNLNIKGYGTKPNNKNKKDRMRPYCLHRGLELFKSTKGCWYVLKH